MIKRQRVNVILCTVKPVLSSHSKIDKTKGACMLTRLNTVLLYSKAIYEDDGSQWGISDVSNLRPCMKITQYLRAQVKTNHQKQLQ